jgi:hypothetical protein
VRLIAVRELTPAPRTAPSRRTVITSHGGHGTSA